MNAQERPDLERLLRCEGGVTAVDCCGPRPRIGATGRQAMPAYAVLSWC